MGTGAGIEHLKLVHVTLNTGDMIIQAPDLIPGEKLQMYRPWLDTLLTDHKAQLGVWPQTRVWPQLTADLWSKGWVQAGAAPRPEGWVQAGAALRPEIWAQLTADPRLEGWAQVGADPRLEGWAQVGADPRPEGWPHFEQYTVETVTDSLFHLKHGQDAVISFAIGVHESNESQALWEELHDLAQPDEVVVTDRAKAPSVPWCGVLCRPGLLAHPDVVNWAASFEQCLSWTMVLRDLPDALGGQLGGG